MLLAFSTASSEAALPRALDDDRGVAGRRAAAGVVAGRGDVGLVGVCPADEVFLADVADDAPAAAVKRARRKPRMSHGSFLI